MKSIHELLEVAIQKRASDLLIKAGSPPALRVDGKIAITTLDVPYSDDTEQLARDIIDSATRDFLLQHRMTKVNEEVLGYDPAEAKMKLLRDREEVDVIFTIPNLVRVRANLYIQRGSIGAVLRIIPLKPHTIEQLGLPAVLKDLATQPQGLMLVTGPTGCGKSTTLAAIIDFINSSRQANIVTVEDPVEYVFEDKKSIVNQREIGTDTKSFAAALRSVLRQTPDVIMIGEMRDVETMNVAMTAAEVGHLVLSTLHTTSAASTIDRIVNSFPPYQKQQVCTQLANSLTGVISQRLVPRAGGIGRIVATEILTSSPTTKKFIEDGETSELYTSMRDGYHFGMHTMNQSLEKLYHEKMISYEDAIANAGNAAELRQMLRRA
ncbi:MAG: PilT/PilU family type 4a pilus ATPase [Armatimonadetes bacterium]|nr:PilT/PilU family type 4a pilus ATPase [Armatimonadota bacterium]